MASIDKKFDSTISYANKIKSINNHTSKAAESAEEKAKINTGISFLDRLYKCFLVNPPVFIENSGTSYAKCELHSSSKLGNGIIVCGFVNVTQLKRPSLNYIATRLQEILKKEYPGGYVIASSRYLFDFTKLTSSVVSGFIEQIKTDEGLTIDYTWLAPLQELKVSLEDSQRRSTIKNGWRSKKKSIAYGDPDDYPDPGEDSPITQFYKPNKPKKVTASLSKQDFLNDLDFLTQKLYPIINTSSGKIRKNPSYTQLSEIGELYGIGISELLSILEHYLKVKEAHASVEVGKPLIKKISPSKYTKWTPKDGLLSGNSPINGPGATITSADLQYLSAAGFISLATAKTSTIGHTALVTPEPPITGTPEPQQLPPEDPNPAPQDPEEGVKFGWI